MSDIASDGTANDLVYRSFAVLSEHPTEGTPHARSQPAERQHLAQPDDVHRQLDVAGRRRDRLPALLIDLRAAAVSSTTPSR